jgi:hypothetical protein
MEILSSADGSAQAVRDAAIADAGGDARTALERELDRLNAALNLHAQAAAQHANWTLLAQAFLITSYFIVLVGGWALPLPGKRWLLAGIAAYALLSLVFGSLAQRGARDRIAPLRASRKLTEQALERVAGRPLVFSRERALSTTLGDVAARLMPWLISAGWLALAVYTLAAPLPTDARATAEIRSEPRASAAPTAAPAPSAAARAKTTQRKAEDTAPAAEPTPEAESPLAALLRRAINTQPPEANENVKP